MILGVTEACSTPTHLSIHCYEGQIILAFEMKWRLLYVCLMHAGPQMMELRNPCRRWPFLMKRSFWNKSSQSNANSCAHSCTQKYEHADSEHYRAPVPMLRRQKCHGGAVQQCTQGNKRHGTALSIQPNVAMPFHCLKESCLCHSAARGHLL